MELNEYQDKKLSPALTPSQRGYFHEKNPLTEIGPKRCNCAGNRENVKYWHKRSIIDPKYIYFYAKNVLGSRFKMNEKHLIKSLKYSYFYTKRFFGFSLLFSKYGFLFLLISFLFLVHRSLRRTFFPRSKLWNVKHPFHKSNPYSLYLVINHGVFTGNLFNCNQSTYKSTLEEYAKKHAVKEDDYIEFLHYPDYSIPPEKFLKIPREIQIWMIHNVSLKFVLSLSMFPKYRY